MKDRVLYPDCSGAVLRRTVTLTMATGDLGPSRAQAKSVPIDAARGWAIQSGSHPATPVSLQIVCHATAVRPAAEGRSGLTRRAPRAAVIGHSRLALTQSWCQATCAGREVRIMGGAGAMLVGAIAASVVLGCQGSADDGGGGSGECGEALVEPARAGCREMASEFCAYYYRCLGEAELAEIEANTGATDQASCAAVTASGVCTPTAVDNPIRECRQTFDQSDIDTCTQRLRALPCMSLSDLFLHPILGEACAGTRGTVPVGGSCVENDDCMDLDGYCNSGACETRNGEQYEILCDEVVGPAPCPGDACRAFLPNAQDIPAFCTRRCMEHEECGLGAACVEAESGPGCMSTCTTDAECSNGLICDIPEGGAVGFCSVDGL